MKEGSVSHYFFLQVERWGLRSLTSYKLPSCIEAASVKFYSTGHRKTSADLYQSIPLLVLEPSVHGGSARHYTTEEVRW